MRRHQVYVAFVRIGTKWRRVGASVVRMFALEMSVSYAAGYEGEVVTRVVLPYGIEPIGESDLTLDQLPEWDGRVWPINGASIF